MFFIKKVKNVRNGVFFKFSHVFFNYEFGQHGYCYDYSLGRTRPGYYSADHTNSQLRFGYKVECHRDKVAVRVTSIYDSLIGHGSTSALLEGGADSEIM